MKTKKPGLLLIVILIVLLVIVLGFITLGASTSQKSGTGPSASVSVKFVSSTITAEGTVTAQNQAALNFQMGGKLTYLPFKEGDKVYQGQTIASLDTYVLRQQLQLAANTYQTTLNSASQTSENQQAGILEGQQRYSLDTSNKEGYAAIPEASVIYDNVQRIVDNANLAQNSAQLSVNLASYALSLATLTSPISGILLSEDVTTSGVNVTPQTSFVVADPSSMVFRANVPTEDIYYITNGSTVSIAIDGLENKLSGTVVRIYPSKVILPGGEAVYPVDIQSDALKKYAKLEQTGTALIPTNSQNMALVPAWTVLSGKYIWADDNGTPNLKQVTSGKIHGSQMEIIRGLQPGDRIIIDPELIQSLKYHLL
jgi:HlyD family secretion protein